MAPLGKGARFMANFVAPGFTLILITSLVVTTYIIMMNLKLDPIIINILAFWMVTEIIGNWIQIQRNKAFVEKQQTNGTQAHGYDASRSHSGERSYNGSNWTDFGSTSDHVGAENTDSASTCPLCHVPVVPRSHHCSLCERCIYVQDHHCFFVGTCIGNRNQKYFVCFCLYASIGCAIAAFYLYTIMTHYRNPHSSEVMYYFGPVVLVQCFLGNAQVIEIWYACLLNMSASTSLLTAGFFGYEMFLILRGQTQFEYKRKIRPYSRSLIQNFCFTFGSKGLIYFLFPFPNMYKMNIYADIEEVKIH